MNSQQRAELAFKAFRNLGNDGKKETLRRWFQKMKPDEIRQSAILLQLLIARDKNAKQGESQKQ